MKIKFKNIIYRITGIFTAFIIMMATVNIAEADSGILKADLNVDGVVTASDLVCMVYHLTGVRILEGQGKVNADISGDNTVNMIDMILLKEFIIDEYIKGSETTTPAPPPPSESETGILSVDGTDLPLGVPVDSMVGILGEPEITFEEIYIRYTITYHIYEEGRENTIIVISDDNTVVGYYTTVSSYTNDSKAIVTEYRDTYQDNMLYAILALYPEYSLNASILKEPDDLSVFNKINFYIMNAIRKINGLPLFTWSATASYTAQSHSRDMAEKNYFSHTSIDGRTLGKRLTLAGIGWMSCAENINAGYWSTFESADSWYNSSGGHRNAILGSYKFIGVGFAYDENSDYGIYGTQDYYS